MVDENHLLIDSPPTVEGRDILYYYGRNKKNLILNGVNITVKRGTIYGLLGPSGCGKTTLLRCIVGKVKPQQGSLLVYGKPPGSRGFFIPGRGVGYMPQDISLYMEISTHETLTYFAQLYKMSKEITKERITFLTDLLKIPDKNALVKNLSGGQQRRVSFATALIHMPPLLILDEPTVGVDPLLRQVIWEHLVSLTVQNHITIIITTHYIEEANQAKVVGMMRNGHLLAEMNPDHLIKLHHASTLENVFLKLCKQDEDKSELCSTSQIQISGALNNETNNSSSIGKSEEIWLVNEISKENVVSYKRNDSKCDDYSQWGLEVFEKNKTWHELENVTLDTRNARGGYVSEIILFFFIMSTLVRKNLLRLIRTLPLMIFVFFIPAVQVITFCLCVGHEPFDLPLAVANMEKDTTGLSLTFLENINNQTITQIQYSNFSLALDSVKRGESWAAIYIGPDFTSCLLKRVIQGVNADNETIDCSSVKVYMDMSNKQIAASLYQTLISNFLTFSSKMLKNMNRNPLIAKIPLIIEEPIYGDVATNFTEFMAPGIILSIMFVMSESLSAVSIVLEKKLGLLERTLIAGVSPASILLSLFISMYLVMLVQVTLVLMFTFFVFEIPSHGPVIWVILCTLLSGICGMCYGFLISAICDDETNAVMMAMGTFYPLLLMGGIIWPLEAMPSYIRYISYCLPFTLLGDSLRSIMARGWTITEYFIWDGLVIALGWSAVFMIISYMIFKSRN